MHCVHDLVVWLSDFNGHAWVGISMDVMVFMEGMVLV